MLRPLEIWRLFFQGRTKRCNAYLWGRDLASTLLYYHELAIPHPYLSCAKETRITLRPTENSWHVVPTLQGNVRMVANPNLTRPPHLSAKRAEPVTTTHWAVECHLDAGIRALYRLCPGGNIKDLRYWLSSAYLKRQFCSKAKQQEAWGYEGLKGPQTFGLSLVARDVADRRRG